MITISNDVIPNKVYQNLRIASGLSPKSDKATAIGLQNTLHFVSLLNSEGKHVGMGRVIGDGGTFCQVVDICILPEWQGKGLGKMIMEDIIIFINTLPESCYISLLADGNAYKLYEKFGFKDTLPQSKGMFLKK